MQALPQLTPSYIAPSAWWEHVPIAHWLVANLKPQTVVELGTHYGVSFFAFCQAAKEYSQQTFVYAVDTWAGDEHAGVYENNVYEQVLAHQRSNYSQISSLLRQTFDEASAYFDDNSVDLLHIDGLHTYEAVRHDFETWLPKLKDGGTILFHDINVREREFGVWQLWRELCDDPRMRCLEVRNGSGLGIATFAADEPAWHGDFRLSSQLFRSIGALYLELAGKQLSLQQAYTDNAVLAAELQESRKLAAALELAQSTYTNQAQGQDTAAKEINPATDEEIDITEDQHSAEVAGIIDPAPSQVSRYVRKLRTGKTRARQILDRQKYKLKRLLRKAGLQQDGNIEQRKHASTGLSVIFISGEPHTPGHRYRVIRIAEAYKAIGASVTILGPTEIASQLAIIADCTILSLWRIAWSEDLDMAISACRENGGKVVFDVDDLMIRPELANAKVIDAIRSNGFDEAKTGELFLRMQQTMLLADLCTTTTHELASQIRLFAKPAMVIPNGYDEQTFTTSRLAYRQRKDAESSSVIRIGYASGSLTHQKDFQYCYEAVAKILRRNPQCRLVLFHDASKTPCLDIREFPALEAVRDQIEWRVLVPVEELPKELARFDINIIPLETGNIFTESKSELKYYEAALVGSCSIASPTGPFSRVIRQGETGYLAGSVQDWEDYLQTLVSNPELRTRLATAALDDILLPYGPVRRVQQISRLAAYLIHPDLRPTVFQAILNEEVNKGRIPGLELPEHDIVFQRDQLGPAAVSVVIPLYNYSEFIEEAMDSVKQQSLKSVDLIVVNDRSTDDSLAVAQQWLEGNHHHFNRVVLASNRSNSKLGPSRNVGFLLAETDYVFALDADNRIGPHCLERCLNVARESKAAFVYPTLQEFGATTGKIGDLEYTPMRLVSGNYIDAMALVSKAAWRHVGGYRNIRFGWEDYDFWCRIVEAGLDARHLQGKPQAFYRVHGNSMLRTTTDDTRNKKELIQHLEEVHPWLHISTPPTDTTVEETESSSRDVGTPELRSEDHAPQHEDRLSALLPMLRCPTSKSALTLTGEWLIADENNEVKWPMVRNTPNLFAGLTDPVIKDGQHISHPLPQHVMERIRTTPGKVLNLSAGGSAEKIPNVVEVEFALFRHTDVIADAHALPFINECFDGIVSMNAFEHYHSPNQVVDELLRVLKPGGWLVVQTAFLQPEHEYPWHFYNTTTEGLKQWFKRFNIDDIRISENFNPIYALSWLASECESALRNDVSPTAADLLRSSNLQTLIDGWRHGKIGEIDLWKEFSRLSQPSQRPIAAGFELIATKP